MSSATVPVFDGHNDTLLRLMSDRSGRAAERFFHGGERGHVDAVSARAGGLFGGLFAVFPPSLGGLSLSDAMSVAPYRLPFPDTPSFGEAMASTVAMVSILLRLETASKGALTICRSVTEIEAAKDAGRMAAVLHVEGAEAIDPDLHALDVLHAAGLRSIGPVWSRPNIFGYGVPMAFPAKPDEGPGLTEAGLRLVRRCNALRIAIDLSHLNEKGFDDVARLSDAPLVATHCNAHALSTHSRNLTDRQLAAIRETGGVVGLNFATGFLRADGCMAEDTGLDVMVRHLDHLLRHLGEDGVALGSDFDGALIPRGIGSAAGLPNLIAAMERAGLPNLIDAMRAAGYGPALIEKIAWRNWLSVLRQTWGA